MIGNEDGSQFVLLDQLLKSDIEVKTRLARNLRGSSLLSVACKEIKDQSGERWNRDRGSKVRTCISYFYLVQWLVMRSEVEKSSR